MSERSVTHATITAERVYTAPPERVFAAWADPVVKARWFGYPDGWETIEYRLDFRMDGRELDRGGPAGGPVYTFDALYQEIVPNRRIVYTYAMDHDQTRVSVSLATVELVPAGDGTRLTVTEQGAFLDGHDTPGQREQVTEALLEELEGVLRREGAAA